MYCSRGHYACLQPCTCKIGEIGSARFARAPGYTVPVLSSERAPRPTGPHSVLQRGKNTVWSALLGNDNAQVLQDGDFGKEARCPSQQGEGSDGGGGRVLHRARDLQWRERAGAVRVRAGAGAGGAVPLHRHRADAHRRRDGTLGCRGQLPAQDGRARRRRLPPDAAGAASRLLALRGAARRRRQPGLRRPVRHLVAVRPVLQVPGGVRQPQAGSPAPAHAHVVLARGAGAPRRRAQKETAQHDSACRPGLLRQEDLRTVRRMNVRTHTNTHTDTSSHIHARAHTHRHTHAGGEVRCTTKYKEQTTTTNLPGRRTERASANKQNRHHEQRSPLSLFSHPCSVRAGGEGERTRRRRAGGLGLNQRGFLPLYSCTSK